VRACLSATPLSAGPVDRPSSLWHAAQFELKSAFPAAASPPPAGAAAAGVASVASVPPGAAEDVAGAASCASEGIEKVSINVKLKNKILEIELWLPTFFILHNDYRLENGTIFTVNLGEEKSIRSLKTCTKIRLINYSQNHIISININL
jgi:hypothetical protein